MTELDVHAESMAAGLVRPDRVHRRIYLDEQVFADELERIFHRTWVYVGHESQIPNPGDFRSTLIGRQPVILTRGAGGEVNVLLNRCTHRAALVCMEASGNTKAFRCSYHGWTFRTDGSIIGTAFPDGYEDGDFAPGEQDLGRAPWVDTHRGFVFASLRADGPSLSEHLGLAAGYVDLFCDLAPTGELDLSIGSHRYGFDGNWKLQCENGVDAYHAGMVHGAYIEALGGKNNPLAAVFHGSSKGVCADLGNGHALLDFRPQLGSLFEKVIRRSDEGEAHYRQLVDRLGADRATEVIRTNGGQTMNLLIFPNILIIQNHVRVVTPRAIDFTDVELFPAALVGATDKMNNGRLRSHEGFYGPAGGGAPDDLEMFRRVHQGLQVEGVEWLLLNRGLHRTEIREDGRLEGHITDEHPQRGFYRQWLAGDDAVTETTLPARARVEEFVFVEAAMIDEARYEEWVELFAEDGRYWVPGSVDQVDANGKVSIIHDDKRALQVRLEWLRSGRAYAQDPRSRTLHHVANIRYERADDASLVVRCATVIWESRPTTPMVAVPTTTTYRIRDDASEWKLAEKKVELLDPTVHHQNLTFLL